MRMFSRSVMLHLDSCDPIDCSLPGSSVHGILQERILAWVAIFFSRGSSQPRDQTQVSCIAVKLFKHRATREVQNNTASRHLSKSFTNVIIQYLQLFPLNKEEEAKSESNLPRSHRCYVAAFKPDNECGLSLWSSLLHITKGG